MNVKIHIDRLTLEGASRADAARFSEALRVHLAALMARGAAPQTPAGSLDHAARQAAARVAGHLKGGRRA